MRAGAASARELQTEVFTVVDEFIHLVMTALEDNLITKPVSDGMIDRLLDVRSEAVRIAPLAARKRRVKA